MAKRSYIQGIKSKQSSPYRGVIRNTNSITAIDGSSKREVSKRRESALRSWTISNNYADEAMRDAQAEKLMNPHGWSKRKNPICQSCYIQKAQNGACGCSE